MDYNENDSELLYLISENNEEAKEMFYDKYKNQIEIFAKKYYSLVKNNGIELSDLIQEGMMGLTDAINNYKNQKNTKFSTFANMCIDRKILNYVRRNTTFKNKILNTSLSIDTTVNSAGRPLLEFIKDENNKNPEDIYINNEMKKEIDEELNKILSVQEKDVFLLRLKGFSYQEISLLLNITKKSVERTMYRAKSKLEKFNKYID